MQPRPYARKMVQYAIVTCVVLFTLCATARAAEPSAIDKTTNTRQVELGDIVSEDSEEDDAPQAMTPQTTTPQVPTTRSQQRQQQQQRRPNDALDVLPSNRRIVTIADDIANELAHVRPEGVDYDDTPSVGGKNIATLTISATITRQKDHMARHERLTVRDETVQASALSIHDPIDVRILDVASTVLSNCAHTVDDAETRFYDLFYRSRNCPHTIPDCDSQIRPDGEAEVTFRRAHCSSTLICENLHGITYNATPAEVAYITRNCDQHLPKGVAIAMYPTLMDSDRVTEFSRRKDDHFTKFFPLDNNYEDPLSLCQYFASPKANEIEMYYRYIACPKTMADCLKNMTMDAAPLEKVFRIHRCKETIPNCNFKMVPQKSLYYPHIDEATYKCSDSATIPITFVPTNQDEYPPLRAYQGIYTRISSIAWPDYDPHVTVAQTGSRRYLVGAQHPRAITVYNTQFDEVAQPSTDSQEIYDYLYNVCHYAFSTNITPLEVYFRNISCPITLPECHLRMLPNASAAEHTFRQTWCSPTTPHCNIMADETVDLWEIHGRLRHCAETLPDCGQVIQSDSEEKFRRIWCPETVINCSIPMQFNATPAEYNHRVKNCPVVDDECEKPFTLPSTPSPTPQERIKLEFRERFCKQTMPQCSDTDALHTQFRSWYCSGRNFKYKMHAAPATYFSYPAFDDTQNRRMNTTAALFRPYEEINQSVSQDKLQPSSSQNGSPSPLSTQRSQSPSSSQNGSPSPLSTQKSPVLNRSRVRQQTMVDNLCGFGDDVPFPSDTVPRTWPWRVEIYANERVVCFGTLISDSTIITAASCLYNEATGKRYDPKELFIGAGNRLRLSTTKTPVFYRNVHDTVVHSFFNYTDKSMYKNVGMLYTSSVFPLSTTIRPICMWNHTLFRTQPGDRNLLKVDQGAIVSLGEDPNEYGKAIKSYGTHSCHLFDPHERDHFCTQLGGKDTMCVGDVGTAFMLYNTNSKRWYLRGIATYLLDAQQTPSKSNTCSVVTAGFIDMLTVTEWVDEKLTPRTRNGNMYYIYEANEALNEQPIREDEAEAPTCICTGYATQCNKVQANEYTNYTKTPCSPPYVASGKLYRPS